MTGCLKCGADCGRYQYCQTHRLAARHDDDARADGGHKRDTGDDKEKKYFMCTECSGVYPTTGSERCPECGSGRKRFLWNPEETDDPWRDESLLRTLYQQCGLTQTEISELFGCHQGTVSTWTRRFEIRTAEETKPYQDADTLRELYYEKGLSVAKIASRFGVAGATIRRSMEKVGLDRRGLSEAHRSDYVNFYTGSDGYEHWDSLWKGEKERIRVHRLLAIASGADPENVFSGEYEIHHENGVPWDNRPENLSALTKKEHRNRHNSKISWLDELRMTEMFIHGDTTLAVLGEVFGISGSHASRVVKGKRRRADRCEEGLKSTTARDQSTEPDSGIEGGDPNE